MEEYYLDWSGFGLSPPAVVLAGIRSTEQPVRPLLSRTMRALNETAALFRLGLLYGYLDVPEVVAWADVEIEAQARPHPALIEVATGAAGGPLMLAEALRPLAEQCRDEQIVGRLLGLMHRALARDPNVASRIARTLYSMALSDVDVGEEAERSMLYFDDALDLARGGYFGSEAEVIEEMLRFLSPYAHSAAERTVSVDVVGFP